MGSRPVRESHRRMEVSPDWGGGEKIMAMVTCG